MPAQGIDYPLVKQTYQERSPEMDNRYVANYYITFDQDGVKPLMFNPTPGYISQYVLNVSSNPVRQIYSDENDAYRYCLAFSADLIYLLSGTARSTRIGNINTASGFVGVTSSTSQVLIVDGSDGYVYDIANETLTTISSDNFPTNPLDCVFFNNYFVVLEKDSNQWFVSAAGTASTWNSQNGVVFNAKADTLKGCAAVNNVLFIFGHYTTEVWYSQANGTFPFTYNSNMLFEYGCAATGSIAEGQGILVWLAGDKSGVGSIYMSDGSKPQKISTKAVDYALRQYGDVSDAVAFLYKEAGHIFYQISFPAANKTWLADLTPDNGQINWTNLTELDGSYHAAICHTYFNNKHLVGSKDSSVVYNLSSNILTQNLQPVHRVVQGTNFGLPLYNRFVVHNFEVNFQGGAGNANNPGMIPKAYLSISRDEGHTFDHKRPAEIGRIGEYKYRQYWLGCGLMRSFTPRLDVYDPVASYILGAKMVMSECSA